MPKALTRTVAILTMLSFANSACVETIPPAPPPTSEAIPTGPALLPSSAGKGRVLIAATNGPARVDEIVGRTESYAYRDDGSESYRQGEIAKPICASTPCAANLDFGEHVLKFESLAEPLTFGRGTVDVGAEDAAFVHTMGGYKNGGTLHEVGSITAALGFLGAATGGGLILYGATRNISPDASRPGQDFISAGEVTLGIGLGVMVLGLVLSEIDHPTYRDGSSRQFPLLAPNR